MADAPTTPHTLLEFCQRRLEQAEKRLGLMQDAADKLFEGATSESLRLLAARLGVSIKQAEQEVLGKSELVERIRMVQTRMIAIARTIEQDSEELTKTLNVLFGESSGKALSQDILTTVDARLQQEIAGLNDVELRNKHTRLTAELGSARTRAEQHHSIAKSAWQVARHRGADSCGEGSDIPSCELGGTIIQYVDRADAGLVDQIQPLSEQAQSIREGLLMVAQTLGEELDLSRLRDASTRLITEKDRLEEQVANLPVLRQKLADTGLQLSTTDAWLSQAWIEFEYRMHELALLLDSRDPEHIYTVLHTERQELDEVSSQRVLSEIGARIATNQAEIGHFEDQVVKEQNFICDHLGQLGISLVIESSALLAALPEMADPDLPKESWFEDERLRLLSEIGHLNQEQRRLEDAHNLEQEPLDLEECEKQYIVASRNRAVKQRATRIIVTARSNMVSRVLPSTEQNLRVLLPQLTNQRYHDAKLTEDYQLAVWDASAGRFVSKDIFSGGTKDQFSLALRLAFALATLPQELGTTPGFIFLDEPLSAFDRPRTDALVHLLTVGQIAMNFAQIFLISHSHEFDSQLFPYYIRMQDGRIVDTNLAQSVPAAV